MKLKSQIGIVLTAIILVLISCTNKIQEKEHVEKRKEYLFEALLPKEIGIDFRNVVKEDSIHNILNYIYYYNGGGVAVGDVNNDSLPDLFFVGNQVPNKLFLNQGDFKFTEIAKKAGIAGNASWNTGVTMVDINADGWLDIYVCAVSNVLDFKGKNELFINNGDGTFTEDAEGYNLDFEGYNTQAYFFDYDKDDDLDVFLVNHAVHTTRAHGKASVRNNITPKVGDVLLQNVNGKFIDVTKQSGIFAGPNGYGLSASLADFNNDGWDDIYVCNDFHEDDYYYLNNQDGTFTEAHGQNFVISSRFSMGSDAGDINNDGFQDLITLDMLPDNEKVLKETEGDDAMLNMIDKLRELGYKDQYSRNMLHVNSQGDGFYENAIMNKMADTDWSWSPLLADFDNDGYADLFISNGILRRPNGLEFIRYVSNAFKGRSTEEGQKWLYNSIAAMPNGIATNQIFKGGKNGFSKKTGEWFNAKPSYSNGSVYADLDLDGNLDLVVNNFNDFPSVYKNTSNNGKAIALGFRYKGQNKFGVGTKVIVYQGERKQLKQLYASRGFLSSVDHQLHFGLGNDRKPIDSIKVIWPDNTTQIIKNNLDAVRLTVNYNPLEVKKEEDLFLKQGNYRFEEVDLGVDFQHKEDNYNDFKEIKLIPYRISNLGPAVAKADIDNNGFEDVFIGAAAGEEAKLYLNNGQTFKPMSIPEIEKDALFEDNTAVFLDADQDGDLDLYVGSGIVPARDGTLEIDRLYINNNLNFIKATNAIPVNDLVTTSVTAVDFDLDGDTDLFIGNLCDADNFGAQVDSYLLENNGKGTFTKSSRLRVKSNINKAKWADVDGDKRPDLLLASEWDVPNVYLNKESGFVKLDLPENLTGLWQEIDLFDMDNDGYKDIVLGNWGLNTKYSLNFDGPLVMYHSDFDLNGSNETLLAYNKDGTYYPLNSKMEMSAQMNIISKLYVQHADFAGKSIEDIIKKGTLSRAKKYESNYLASGYIKNDNGTFKEFVPLPNHFQLAPLTQFEQIELDNKTFFMVAGNSERVNTYHGKYMSLGGIIGSSVNNYKQVKDYGIAPFSNQITFITTIKMKAGRQVIFVVPNNDKVKTYITK